MSDEVSNIDNELENTPENTGGNEEQQTPATDPSAITSEWALWEKLLNLGSESAVDARELAIEQSVEAFIAGMTEDPAYQADALVEGVNTPIVASRKSALECSIKAAPGTDLHIGDLVECLDEDWLVVDLYTDKVGILNGTMWICNDIIRFQNNSSAVNTRYCVIDDGSYSRKMTDPIAYVPVNTYKLYLSMDAATIRLYIDKRLSFGTIYAPDGSEILETYKIMGIDLKSKNLGEGSHLMVLTMQRDVYNETTDSLSQNLCDVYVAPGHTSAPQLTGSCVVVGRDAIRLGTTRKYSVTFTNAEGEIVNDVVPIWNISAPNGVTTSTADGVVSVVVPLQESLVGSEIKLTATSEGGVYGTYEKKVQVIAVG